MYAWALGTKPCQNDVLDWLDPFASQRDQSAWSFTGARGNISPMPEGRYYLSVRGFNNVIRGGPLATTVCDTVPLIIDMTKPVKNEFIVAFDDSIEYLVITYNFT